MLNSQQFTRTITIKQSLSDFGVRLDDQGNMVNLDGSRIKRNYAFKDWLNKSVPGEKLPRGKFFKDKKPTYFHSGFMDEFSTINNAISELSWIRV